MVKLMEMSPGSPDIVQAPARPRTLVGVVVPEACVMSKLSLTIGSSYFQSAAATVACTVGEKRKDDTPLNITFSSEIGTIAILFIFIKLLHLIVYADNESQVYQNHYLQVLACL